MLDQIRRYGLHPRQPLLLVGRARRHQDNHNYAAEQRRSAVNAAREAWFEGQLDLDPTRIVFIDETAANTKMARLYGRAPRASDAAPCPMAIGKPSPSPPGCVTTGSLRLWSSTVR
jgi:hypothetical protein